MSLIHEEITRDGLEAVIARSQGKADRAIAEIAASIMGEESTKLGMTYAGFCFTALPHKKLSDDARWVRESKNAKLIIEPGAIERNNEIVSIGVPYGSRARLILIYLQTEAIKHKTQVISLGQSMQDWLTRMGISKGGKSYQDIREQSDRISACHLKFVWNNANGSNAFINSTFVRGGIAHRSCDVRQGELWTDQVVLSDDYYRALNEHAVPLWEPAIREIGNRSMALDVYIWLAYRLHVLDRPTPVSWASLMEQFGAGFSNAKHFKAPFREALAFAMAVYQDAKVDLLPDGVVLHPSRSPVPKNVISFAPTQRKQRSLESTSR